MARWGGAQLDGRKVEASDVVGVCGFWGVEWQGGGKSVSGSKGANASSMVDALGIGGGKEWDKISLTKVGGKAGHG